MPKRRLGARSAGVEVARRVERLNADLLTAETACFEAITGPFADAVPAVGKLIAAAYPKLLTKPDLRGQLVQLAAAATAVSEAPVTVLCATSVDLAVEALTDELGVMERALAARYRGIAAASRPDGLDALVDVVVEEYVRNSTAALVAFATACREQLSVAVSHGDPVEDVLARFVNLEPNRLHGLSGRGVWWRPPTVLHGMARAVSISAANTARTHGIHLANRTARGVW